MVKKHVIEHELVPKHEILSPAEREKLLNTLKIKPQQLPKILDKDPVAMKLGARPGDIIKITRKSPTAGESTYYRYVVGKDVWSSA
jgi:DNA-directed RNA polymerase subunit H